MRPIKIKPIKIHFNFDLDNDKVKDHKDCRPFNKKFQHWDEKKAKQMGATIAYISPDEYLRRTGFTEKTSKDYREKYLEKYYDTEKEEMRPIKELSDHIKNPNKKVSLPYVGESPYEHEGRHRAYAGKLAGQEKIPVIVPSLTDYSMEEREAIGRAWVKARGFDRDPGYANEWIRRFRSGHPENYITGVENREMLYDILRNWRK